MKEKIITTISYPIKLGQFLKLINVAQDGLEAKFLIQEGKVLVNQKIDRRRGRQLTKGDVVELQDGTAYILS